MDTRRSRFVIEKRGTSHRITKTDLVILDLLQRYRYLPSTYLLTFLSQSGKTSAYYKKRLTHLRHELQVIDCPQASWHAANARYRPAVYMLTSKGVEALKQHGMFNPKPKSGEPFAHELMVNLFHASLELGVRDNSKLSFISSAEILGNSKCPEETRLEKRPFRVPISFFYTAPKSRHSVHIKTHIRHDGDPFGIAYTEGGTTARIFFPGIEADRTTEPLSPEEYGRSSIRRKLYAIKEAAKNKTYRAHYGIPNYIVPFVTINPTHMYAMMALVNELSDGRGSKMILFKNIPDFSSFETFPPATDHFLSEPWQRVGYPPFDIVGELKDAANKTGP